MAYHVYTTEKRVVLKWILEELQKGCFQALILILTLNFLFDRQDLNHFVVSSENPINSIFFNKILCFTVSKVFCKSIEIIPV